MMLKISKTGLIAPLLAPLLTALMIASELASNCNIEHSLKETKLQIEELQRNAFKRDRKYLEIAKVKITQLGDLRQWTEFQRKRAMTNILSKASAMTMGERASALSKRSEALDSAKRGDDTSCEKLASLPAIFVRLDALNESTWKILLKFIDRQIARETSQTQ